MGAMEEFRTEYTAEPTVAQFHRSEAFIRGIRGPVGSGKSVGCVVEIVKRGLEQAPNRKKVRRTRWAAIRNTYPELKSTTIKTFQEWCPPNIAPIRFDVPITARMILELPDGTTADIEILFLSVDRPADVGKLKSLDLTGLWLNEASELPKAVLDMATARVGRFPSKKDGAPLTWCGVIMDTNSMDDDHWWHDLAEGPTDPEQAAEIEAMKASLQAALADLGIHRPLMEFWTQPPALLEVNGSYAPNPAAENARNQQLGYAYWLQQIVGKSKEWIDLFVLNKYGRVIDGRVVYPEYNEHLHGKKRQLTPIPGLPIIIGLDAGLSPAAAIMQCTPKGQLMILGECVALERSMGMRAFMSDALKPFMANRFGTRDPNGNEWKYSCRIDPAAVARADSDESTALKMVEEAGFAVEPAKTNAFLARRESLAWYMTRLIAGEPALMIDESARMIRKGLAGGYHYRRVQVSGEARYQDQPYKNKYSHPVEAAQYGALEYIAVEAPGQKRDAVPSWMKRLNQKGSAGFMAR